MALALELPRIQISPLSAWINQLVDFRPHLLRFVKEFEAGPIAQYYVDLACKQVEVRNSVSLFDAQIHNPIDFLFDKWIREPGPCHISVLGDFGTGKTWLARKYAYDKAVEYLQNPKSKRIPIFFDLSEFNSVYGIAGSIVRRLEQDGVKVARGTDTLSFLNSEGKLLFILDGFDQMEQRVDANGVAIRNFWELSGLFQAKSKIILMARTHYFRYLAEEISLLNPLPRTIKVPVDRQRLSEMKSLEGKYRLLHLLPLNDSSIKLALKKRRPIDYEAIYDKIQSIYDFGGLAGRPVLLDLIVKTYPSIENIESLDQSKLYEIYFQDSVAKDYRFDSSLIPPPQRLEFVRNLAWNMFANQHIQIPSRLLTEEVKSFFGLSGNEILTELYEREVRSQPYLVRDDDDKIRFGHESFKEFLVAQRVAKAFRQRISLATLLEDRIDIAARRLYLRGIYKFLRFMIQPDDEKFLLQLIDSPYSWERLLAVYLLGRPISADLREDIIGTLVSRVNDEPDIMTRREICYALARLGREEFLEQFVQEIKLDHNVMEAVYQIGYFDYHHDRGGPLEEIRWRLMNKVDQAARVEYVHFLGEYGDLQCRLAIESYLEDTNKVVRQEAQEAIEKLSSLSM